MPRVRGKLAYQERLGKRHAGLYTSCRRSRKAVYDHSSNLCTLAMSKIWLAVERSDLQTSALKVAAELPDKAAKHALRQIANIYRRLAENAEGTRTE